MDTRKLFKHIRTFENEPVFRNTTRPVTEAAFDDLLDQQDDRRDAFLALAIADHMRSFYEISAPFDPSALRNLAILKVFQRPVHYPSRYGDGSFAVWYGSLAIHTTIYETAFHMIREEADLKGHSEPIERHRVIYKVACTAILIDLTRDNTYLAQLTDSGNYSITQQIGKRIRSEMHPGLISPSARDRDNKGINLAAFTPQILTNPEVNAELLYQLDPQTMLLTIIDQQDQQTVFSTEFSIDGRRWF